MGQFHKLGKKSPKILLPMQEEGNDYILKPYKTQNPYEKERKKSKRVPEL